MRNARTMSHRSEEAVAAAADDDVDDDAGEGDVSLSTLA